MSRIFIDCETCGLPISPNRNVPSKQTHNWPHIVQVSWILEDGEGNHIETGDYIVRPSGYEISEDSTKIHGISHEKATKEGMYICDVLEILERAIERAEWIVCHNTAFDLKVLEASFYRCKMNSTIFKTKRFCTMQHPAIIDFCAIPFAKPSKYPQRKGREFKWPRLSELYNKCFGMDFPNAHNSLADVRATRDVYHHLSSLKII